MMTSFTSTFTRCTGVVALLLLLGLSTQDAAAQFDQKAMAVGDLHHIYTETGGQQEYWYNAGYGLIWPGIYGQGFLRADAQWIGVRDFTDENGRTWPAKVVHVGPRATGFGAFFPQEFTTTQRFEGPVVTVDGLESLDKAAEVDEVDSSIPADRIIRTVVNTQTGITMEKRILGWSQEHHDDYHIQEYVLTNTGNTDADEEVELNQPAEDVYLHFQRRYVYEDASIPGSGWGANVMNDIVGDGLDDYEVDFRATYTWLGNSQNADIDPLGAPAEDDSPSFIPEGDDQGQLTATAYAGVVTLHADTGPNDDTDDPNQPSMTGHIDADDPLTSANDPFNEAKMQREYTFMSEARPAENNGPHMWPHHADLPQSDLDGDFTTADGTPMLGKAGGWTSAWSYGPYDLAPGESVRIVIAEAADGFNRRERVLLGRAFKQNGFDPEAPIEIDADYNGTIDPDESMGKNDWVIDAGRDSLFQTFEKAIANFESGYSIPNPPLPPSSFSVTSGVDQIQLEWTTFDGANPQAFEIYRTRNLNIGDWQDLYQYQRIATVGPNETSYTDTDVVRGINYYYYIVAVGATNNDGTAMTPTGRPLRSGRYFTQTYDPATLKRGPGETTSAFKVVPNPYNIASDPQVRWPGQQDQIGFLDVPGNCVIRIYTELGELVRTIRHDDGSGDEYWDLTTEDRQLVASGIYIAVVENLDNGEQSTKKFVIIR